MNQSTRFNTGGKYCVERQRRPTPTDSDAHTHAMHGKMFTDAEATSGTACKTNAALIHGIGRP